MKKHVLTIPAIILLMFSAEVILAAGLSDTGQTKCYNNTAELTPCPAVTETFYGQDAQYSYVQPSFTKLNADGSVWTGGDPHVMVRDNVTGLIWEVKTDDGSIHDKDNAYTRTNVETDFINELNYTDVNVPPEERPGYGYQWRLPTIKELLSIANYGTYNPTIDTEYFLNTNSLPIYPPWAPKFSPYWSSNDKFQDTNNSWCFDFKEGKSYSYYISNPGYALAVRCDEPIPTPTLVKNSDDTVTDIKTGLTWYIPQTQPAPPTLPGPILVNWSSALDYCKNMQVGINADWRMPNIRELASIIKLNTKEPAADTDFFSKIMPGPYWSSTTNVNPDSLGTAYIVGFQFGTVDIRAKSASMQEAYVIAVQGGNYGTFAAKADLNKDSRVNLTDAILALQICGGLEPVIDTTFGIPNIDIDADLKIGMPEAIYILQEVAGIYRCL